MSFRVDFAERRQSRPVWLITLADLVALLLAFFVMPFATIEVELTRWAAMIQSLSQSLNPNHTVHLKRASAIQNIDRLSRRRAIDLTYLEALFREITAAAPALARVVLHRREDRLVIALPSDELFRPGGAVLVPSSRPMFQALGAIPRRVGNGIDVYGHTDPTPATQTVYASNWGLSVARAVAVANEARRAGYHKVLPVWSSTSSHRPGNVAPRRRRKSLRPRKRGLSGMRGHPSPGPPSVGRNPRRRRARNPGRRVSGRSSASTSSSGRGAVGARRRASGPDPIA